MEQTIEDRVRHIISVTEELIALAAEENRRLMSGRSNNLQDIVIRKGCLIRVLEGWLNQTRAYPDVLSETPPSLHAKLSALTGELAEALADSKSGKTVKPIVRFGDY